MERAYQRPAIEDLGTLADITLGNDTDLSDITGLGSGIGGSDLTPASTPDPSGLGLNL